MPGSMKLELESRLTREISITNSSLHSRKIEKEQTKPKISIKKAIIKIRIQIK